MSIRSVSCKLVLLAVLLGVTILPCVPVQAGGFPAPGLESTTSWFAPILEWLGWGANGDEAFVGMAQSGASSDLDGPLTPSLESSTATTEEDDDDRNSSLDPNG